MGVTFKVESVGSDSGRVVLSRIAWPGYAVDGGTISSDEVDGFLMAVDLNKHAAGTVVKVAFRSPAWFMQSLAGALLILIATVWPILAALARRSLRRGVTKRRGRAKSFAEELVLVRNS
jgi:hypothetical protein